MRKFDIDSGRVDPASAEVAETIIKARAGRGCACVWVLGQVWTCGRRTWSVRAHTPAVQRECHGVHWCS